VVEQTLIDVRDMAIVHRAFRDAFSESARLVRADPTPSPARLDFVGKHVAFVISLLQHHHEGEDELLFPLLAERVPDQAEMVHEVEAQHHDVVTAMASALEACAAWQAAPSPVSAETLAERLDTLNETLQPHLDDEEGRIVPLAAQHLSQSEWDALGDNATQSIPRKMLPIAFGLITESLNPDDTAHMRSHLPPPVRMLYPVLIGRPWKKYARTLRHGT
jgi:iron-sulfur cluster repair protein YtfE (RIC family)